MLQNQLGVALDALTIIIQKIYARLSHNVPKDMVGNFAMVVQTQYRHVVCGVVSVA